MKKTIAYLLALMAITSLSPAFAEEPVESPEIPEEYYEEYVFPVVKPEGTFLGGYRYVHLNGSERAEEFEYLRDSWTLGGELNAFSFPHRYHLELDIKNRKDYFGDTSYAYEDIILFRGITRTIFHNLDNILLIDLDPATSGPAGQAVAVRDEGHLYGVKTNISNAFLRLKAPDFPFHLYAEGMEVKKDGELQQRSLIGSGYFNNIVRASERRSVDSKATTLTVGANSHLGPIEVDYSHSEKRFSADGDNVLYDEYQPAGFGPPLPSPLGSVRNGGIYPHNLLPELKSTADTIKVHTSYTGALSASATFSAIEKENRDSGAVANYFIGAGDLTWIASRDLAFFFKYRQRESKVNDPEEVEYADLCKASLNAAGTYACDIKESISTRTSSFSAAARYRLTSGIVVRGEYSHENIAREAADEWFMPDETRKNAVTLSTNIRLSKHLKMNLKYMHTSIQNPAYNSEPHQANEGNISVSWSPVSWMSALASLQMTSERRNKLQFVHTETVAPFEEVLVDSPGDRKLRRERFLGSVTILPAKELTATLTFFYLHNKQKEDLAYHDDVGEHFFDSGVVNRDTVRNVSFDIQYLLAKHTALSGGVSTTESKGKFHPGDPNLLLPLSVASFSELETRETVYTLGGEVGLKGGFTFGTHYKYAVFKDLLNNPYDDIRNGEAHILILSLTKRW